MKPKITGKIAAQIQIKILSIDDTGVIMSYETANDSGVIHGPHPDQGILPGDTVMITHNMDVH